MPDFRISITMENAAFEDDPGLETARILREIADKLQEDGGPYLHGGDAVDINGNKVGWYSTQLMPWDDKRY